MSQPDKLPDYVYEPFHPYKKALRDIILHPSFLVPQLMHYNNQSAQMRVASQAEPQSTFLVDPTS